MSIEQFAGDTGQYTPERLNTIRLLNCLCCITVGLNDYDSIAHDPGNPESSPIQAALKYYRLLDNWMVDAYELIALEPPSELLTRVKVAMHLSQLHVLDGVLMSAIEEATAESEEEGVGFVSDLIKEAYDLGWLELKRAEAEYQVYSEVQQEEERAAAAESPQDEQQAQPDHLMSPREIAARLGKGYNMVRKKLDRHRKGNPGCFVEVTDRKPTDAQYLYYWQQVKDLFN